jgi:hypothetical protein
VHGQSHVRDIKLPYEPFVVLIFFFPAGESNLISYKN